MADGGKNIGGSESEGRRRKFRTAFRGYNRRDVAQFVGEFDDSYTQMEEYYRAQLEAAAQDVGHLRAENELLKKKAVDAGVEREKAAAALQECNVTIANLQAQLAVAPEIAPDDDTLAQLQATIADLQAQLAAQSDAAPDGERLADLTEQIAARDETIASLQAAVAENNRIITDLREQLAATQEDGKVAELQATIAELQARLASSPAPTENQPAAPDAPIADLRELIDTTSKNILSQLDVVYSSNEDLRGDVTEVNNSLCFLDEKIDKILASLAELSSKEPSYGDGKAAELTEQLAARDATIADLQERLAESGEGLTRESFDDVVATAERSVAEAEERVAACERRARDLESALAAAEIERDEARAQAATAQTTSPESEKILAEAKAQAEEILHKARSTAQLIRLSALRRSDPPAPAAPSDPSTPTTAD